jgi:excisionase family DNA binding protein
MDETTEAQVNGSGEAQERSGTSRLVWSVEEAGRLLGISRAHAYELVARGDLPHLRLGRRIVVPKRALDELLGAV